MRKSLLAGLGLGLVLTLPPWVWLETRHGPGSPPAPASPPAAWQAGIQGQLARREYEASPNERGLQAPNRAHNLRTYFAPEGVRVHDRSASGSPALVAFELAALGRGEQRRAVSPGEVVPDGARVEIRRGDVVEWYENSPAGLEQGFDLASRPPGEGELWLELALEGAHAVGRGGELELRSATGRRLRYAKLAARDSAGRSVPARMELVEPSVLRLVVADADAAYPLVIDPLLTSTEDTLLQADQGSAQLGVHVASAGDVNGDGFGDVIVGANLYDAGESDEGAAFVFLGSAAGIADADSASAATQLEANQDTSQFGRSVASAGDVNGDGYDDVIVGARFYDLGQSDEGVALIFLGGPGGVADGDPSTAATVLQSNQGNGQLGMDVAGAGDVNGDGYADVIVGAWGYSAGEGAEGAAFVFHGSASGVADGDPATAETFIQSNQAAANLGVTVAGAGDVNGDGYADVLVGSRIFDNPEVDEGAVLVFLGGAAGIPDGDPTTADALLQGDQGGANFGWGLAGAGDVNGDGYADVIVGALAYDAGESNEGAAFVFHGGPSGIASGNPASAAAQIESNQAGGQLGSGVAGAGDVNGDGYGDVVVGARFYTDGENDEGAAFVFLGGPSGVGAGDPTTAHASFFSDQADAHLGSDVAGAGDVNGDGYADVIAGAELYDAAFVDSGAAFVFLGGNEGIVGEDTSAATMQLDSDQPGAELGFSVAGAGDVNGDGYSDIVIGAPYYDSGGVDGGAAFVFLGGSSGLADVDLDDAAQIASDQANAHLGIDVAGAGDVNGDGYGDVIVGAAEYNHPEVNEGVALVFHGGPAGLPGGSPATANALIESDQISAALGISVASAGDVNGDGYGDVIVGAVWFANPEENEGAAFIFHGSPSGISGLAPAAADTVLESNLEFSTVGPATSFGSTVAGAGDVNGDGYSDVIVGAWGYDAGALNEGAAFVFLGGPSGVPDSDPTSAHARLMGQQQNASFGVDVAAAGDVNGDGYGDIIVGASSLGVPTGIGAAFVFHGSSAGIAHGGPDSASTSLLSDSGAGLGTNVAGVGDVNGDGYADVVVSDYGRAVVFLGSANGIADATPAAAAARLQHTSLVLPAGAGDVNGDGFADVLLGAPDSDAALLFLGNGGRSGREVLARQLVALPHPAANVAPFALAGDADTFRVRITRTSPAGRVRYKGEVEACPSGAAFGSLGCVTTVSPTWIDAGINSTGSPLLMGVTGLAPNTLYRWRARLLMVRPSATTPGVVPPPNPAHTPWRRLNAQLVEGDVRTLPDADLDGFADGTDNCPTLPNPTQEDADGDGVGSLCDNCPLEPNPLQENNEGDGLGDVCDSDDDDDGVADNSEPGYGTDPFDADSDDDGANDGAELLVLHSDPLDPDSDDDTALDGSDNCPLLVNADQLDADMDARGDACDNCRRTANFDQADAGGLNSATPDGVGNVCQNGDWNGDGIANLVDIVIIRRHLAGLDAVDPRMPPGP